ncbi:hypothetical protein K340107D12_48190 [Blautia parvula]|uniref:Uncharacterized protein n=1 Tax=Blautia parvula TaxID=2877527 RepID=A0ABQ0BZM4_9FIRM
MMGAYLKENNVKVKDGTDVNSILISVFSVYTNFETLSITIHSNDSLPMGGDFTTHRY